MHKFRNSLLIVATLLVTATVFIASDASAFSAFKRPATWGTDEVGPSTSTGEPDVGGGQKNDPPSQPNSDPDSGAGIVLRGSGDLYWIMTFMAQRFFGVGW